MVSLSIAAAALATLLFSVVTQVWSAANELSRSRMSEDAARKIADAFCELVARQNAFEGAVTVYAANVLNKSAGSEDYGKVADACAYFLKAIVHTATFAVTTKKGHPADACCANLKFLTLEAGADRTVVPPQFGAIVSDVFYRSDHAPRFRHELDRFSRKNAAGGNLKGIESVASFFISRVDTEIDRRLSEVEAKGGDRGASAKRLRGQAAIANARLAYQVYEDMLHTPRWQTLAAAGAQPQRLLWASTGVKDKSFEDTRYVIDLVAPDTVNTMPEATLRAVADHGVVRGDTVRSGYDAAWDTADELRRLGINSANVSEELERQGIATFVKSWNDLIASVTEQIKAQEADVRPRKVQPVAGDGDSSRPRRSTAVDEAQ